VLTAKRAIIGIAIIIAGIALSSAGFALTSQTPETITDAEGWLEGLAEWIRNIGIEFAKGLGIGLYYLGFIVIAIGVILLIYWRVTS